METSKIYKKYTIISAFLLIYGALIMSLVILLLGNSGKGFNIEKLESPAIVILAIVISVLTFTLSSAVFSAIGKGKNSSALGMPDGSIRALIALSLIALFFIMATQIYSKVSQNGVGKLEHISEDNLKEYSLKDIVSKKKVDSLKNPAYDAKAGDKPQYFYFYDISVKVATNSDAADMAKNIVASFITLISAISGFYFGSASSKPIGGGSNTGSTPSPTIKPKNTIPTTGQKGVPMTFEWEVSPPGQQVIVQVAGDTEQAVADAANPLKFVYTPGNVGAITLKVSMKNNSAIYAAYPITIT